jgi:hypothetical protein
MNGSLLACRDGGRRFAQQVQREIIEEFLPVIGLVDGMARVGQHHHVHILAGIDQRLFQTEAGGDRHIVVDVAMDQQQLALQVLRHRQVRIALPRGIVSQPHETSGHQALSSRNS